MASGYPSLCAGCPAAAGPGHPSDGTEVRELLAAACCRVTPGRPAEVERSPFPTTNTAGGLGTASRATDARRAGTARGDLAEAAMPRRGSAGGREGIKEGRCRHLLAPPAVTPPRWQGARPPAPGHATLRGAGSERGDEGRLLGVMPVPAGKCHRASAQWLRRLPGTPGRVGMGGQRATWRVPLTPFFPGLKPGPSDA